MSPRSPTATERPVEPQVVEKKVIARQNETIRDLAAPVIKVWDEVLCLPIVGAVDTDRVAEMMEYLLEAIVRERRASPSSTTSGVSAAMDTSTVHHVVRMMKAAQTVGAIGVLSGTQPAVAQTIVSLGLSLDDLRSVRTLHDALVLGIARRQPTPRSAPAAASTLARPPGRRKRPP